MKKLVMTFEVAVPIDDVIDEETFKEEYGSDPFKLCEFMCREEGVLGWYDEELKLKSAVLNQTP